MPAVLKVNKGPRSFEKAICNIFFKMTTGIDKLQLLLTKDTRHSAEEHSDRRVKRERSSKTTLPRLCNNHDAISPRYSAPAYIKYAQSVSSKISDSIQQNQHRFNYDHKVRNKRTEPAHHTDFFAKQSHTHNDSTGIMEKSSKTDCHLDLDPETSWTVPLYVPTPPPVLAAAGHDDVCQNQVSRFPLSTEETSHPSPKIECCFSSYNNEYFLDWTGPDLLSPSSCTDDVFLYLSAFYPREKLDWADIRLCVLINATEEVVAIYPFSLPRTESILGNLSQVRQLVHDRIVSHDVEDLHFRLIVRPKSQEAPGSMGTEKTFSSYFRPVVPISPLDPYFFVQNIAGNY